MWHVNRRQWSRFVVVQSISYFEVVDGGGFGVTTRLTWRLMETILCCCVISISYFEEIDGGRLHGVTIRLTCWLMASILHVLLFDRFRI